MADTIKISEARSKITRLDKILKPGEVLEITKRGKAYARLELVSESDRYDEVLQAIEALPEPKRNKRSAAKSYKSFIYGKGHNNT